MDMDVDTDMDMDMENTMINIKCVTVGDGNVGKTCMLIRYLNGDIPSGEYIPTVYDTFLSIIKDDGRLIRFELWDTAGQEDYDRLRPLSYPDTDVFMVCFSIGFPSSFENVERKWIPEIKHFCPESKIILVCTKYDTRENSKTVELLKLQKEEPISYTQGFLLAQKIGAVEYKECSSISGVGMAEVFNAATQAVLHPPKRVEKRKTMCSIL